LWCPVFGFEDIKQFGYKPALTKKRMIFVKTGLYPNYLISSKQKTWCHKLLLNAKFGIQEGSVGFRDSSIQTSHGGIPAFSFEVDRASCLTPVAGSIF